MSVGKSIAVPVVWRRRSGKSFAKLGAHTRACAKCILMVRTRTHHAREHKSELLLMHCSSRRRDDDRTGVFVVVVCLRPHQSPAPPPKRLKNEWQNFGRNYKLNCCTLHTRSRRTCEHEWARFSQRAVGGVLRCGAALPRRVNNTGLEGWRTIVTVSCAGAVRGKFALM